MANIFPPADSVYAELVHELEALGGLNGSDFVQDRTWDGVTFAVVSDELYDKWTGNGSGDEASDEATDGAPKREEADDAASNDAASNDAVLKDAGSDESGKDTRSATETQSTEQTPDGSTATEPPAQSTSDTAADAGKNATDTTPADASAGPEADTANSDEDSAEAKKTPSGTAPKRSALKNTSRRS
jgi:hypothetical protein